MDKEYRVAVCNDELYFKRRIKELLMRYFHRKHRSLRVDIFPSGEVFLENREKANQYAALFLDITRKENHGLETAYEIRKYNKNLPIVFVADTMDYVLEGYKVDAIRYIMKNQLESLFDECMDAVMEKIQHYSIKEQSFFVCGDCLLDPDKIVYLESNLHKVSFYMCGDYDGKRDLAVYDKLDTIENELSDDSFLRIHKSYLVNMKYIKKISGYFVYLCTGDKLPASKSLYKQAREKFSLYKG